MKILISILFGITSLTVFSQLQTSGGLSPTQLVQNVLVGQGVDVSNVNYYGSPNAIGTFNGTNTNIGINEGIIMTTGTIYNTPGGPFGPNNKTNSGVDNGYPGYAPLTSIVGAATYNAAVLEFDFIPYSDTVKFKYVFASEEYPEYVNSVFNDVFAFYISGPGIPGGTKNMAIIPGTNQPVTINNVNAGSNSAYYQYNGDGNTAPYDVNPHYVQYDGLTVPMEAYSKVQCGKKYHLIIAITDVSDGIWDSGIFLEKNSLSSNQPVQVKYTLSSDPFGDGVTMAQGCTSATVTLTRSGTNLGALDIPVTVSGTAVSGLDYSPAIPLIIHFNPGQTTTSFSIDALNNPGLTGTANIFMSFDIVNACGEHVPQQIELFIKPIEPVAVSVNDTILKCPGGVAELFANATGGGGGYTYSWNTGDTSPSISVSPTTTQTYTVSVTDACLHQTATASGTVTVPIYQPLTIDATDDITEQCPFEPNTLSVEATGASGDYTYQWIEDTTGNMLGVLPSVDVAPYATSTYTVVVNDFCGETDTAHVKITILSPPLLLTIDPVQQVCPHDSAQITVYPTGGFGNYYYFWPGLNDSTQTVWVTPDSTTEYFVIVKDDCQTFQVNTSTTVEVVKPKADFDIVTSNRMVDFPITFDNTSQGASTYFWDFGDGRNSTMIDPNHTFNPSGKYYVQLIATNNLGCKDTVRKPISILKEFYLYVPNSFTPDGNRNNNEFLAKGVGVKQFYMSIYNRWGELVFESKDINIGWDGAYGDKLAPIGTYVWKIDYKSVNDKDMQHKVGHVNLIR